MSIYTQQGFKAYYDNVAGPFAETLAKSVTGATLQQLCEDIGDSTLFSDSFQNTDMNYFESEDWIGVNATPAINRGWTAIAVGAGSFGGLQGTYGTDAVEKAMGEVLHTTGTTATGYGGFYKNVSIVFGLGHTFRFRGRNVLQTLGSGAERYTAYFGFGDTPGAGDMVDGAYFRYADNVNSGKWECVTSAASVRTATDSGVTAVTTYSIFEIRVNSTGTSVAFYIDGTLVATNTLTIPTAATQMIMKIEKSVGTTTRNFDQDWYDLSITRASAR